MHTSSIIGGDKNHYAGPEKTKRATTILIHARVHRDIL